MKSEKIYAVDAVRGAYKTRDRRVLTDRVLAAAIGMPYLSTSRDLREVLVGWSPGTNYYKTIVQKLAVALGLPPTETYWSLVNPRDVERVESERSLPVPAATPDERAAQDKRRQERIDRDRGTERDLNPERV